MKPLFTIANSATQQIANPVLLLKCGERHLIYAILESDNNHCPELGYYAIEREDTQLLDQLMQFHPDLARSYKKIVVGYDHSPSTLVPTAEFDEKDGTRILHHLYGVNGLSVTFHEGVSGWPLKNVYAVPVAIEKEINNHFPGAARFHQYSVTARHFETDTSNGQLLVDFRKEDFTVVAAKDGKLLLTQTYEYASPEDVLFYLLKICQQFQLSQQDVLLSVSGLVDQQSALYKELFQYFIQIQFRVPGWTMAQSDYPEHFFTTINDLAQCAL